MTIPIIIFTILFFFITYRHIHLGIYLFFLLLPTYLIRFSIFNIPTTLLEIMFGIIFLIWIATFTKKYINILKSYIIRYKLLFISSIIFLLGATISIFTSIDTRSALGEWKAFYIEPYILFIILITTIRTEFARNTIMTMLIISGLATSIFAILQHFTGWMVPWAFWENNNTFRVTAWYGFPNGVGLFLAPLVPLTLYFFIEHIKKLQPKKVKKNIITILLLLSMFSFILATYFAKSTGGLIAIIASIVLLLVIYKKTRWITIFIGLISVITMMSIPNIRNELLFQDRTGQIRISIYHETINFLKDNPITGAGLASYAKKIKPYHSTVNGEGIEIFHHPHNLFLTMWVNTGLIGLIGFLLLILAIFRLLILSNPKAQQHNNITIFIFTSFITLLITGLVDSPYIKNDLAMLFWTLIALNFSAHRLSRETEYE